MEDSLICIFGEITASDLTARGRLRESQALRGIIQFRDFPVQCPGGSRFSKDRARSSPLYMSSLWKFIASLHLISRPFPLFHLLFSYFPAFAPFLDGGTGVWAEWCVVPTTAAAAASVCRPELSVCRGLVASGLSLPALLPCLRAESVHASPKRLSIALMPAYCFSRQLCPFFPSSRLCCPFWCSMLSS